MERLDVSASMLYPKIFLRSNKKYFFERMILKKNIYKKNVPILDSGKDSLPKSNMNPYQNPVWARFFFRISSLEKIFFVGPQIFFGHSFEVETSNLLIYDVFGTF